MDWQGGDGTQRSSNDRIAQWISAFDFGSKGRGFDSHCEPKQEKENGSSNNSGGGGDDLKKDQPPPFSNIKWGELLLSPDPDNILAVGLTGLLAWASVQKSIVGKDYCKCRWVHCESAVSSLLLHSSRA
ncbi:unnamed protein product [Dovyalis caffra]|uniref:Uncharacterized protein n=1 Tax=Dovyalis caffra TaxID=77055 RepID=A0AAV1QWX7_9ROSI|nr:unnamed protein product [Dovyalis caffra]